MSEENHGLNEKPKKKRKRIKVHCVEANSKITGLEYGDGYGRNAASENAKYLREFTETWNHEFWIDKHYTNRKNFGDASGPREGIEEIAVESLIKKSVPHLFYYSLKHTFPFINFPPRRNMPYRVVLKELSNTQDTLNVVAEFHFLDTNKYEITVRTAMRVNDFHIQDNQYFLEFSDNESILFLKKNKVLNRIDCFS